MNSKKIMICLKQQDKITTASLTSKGDETKALKRCPLTEACQNPFKNFMMGLRTLHGALESQSEGKGGGGNCICFVVDG